MTDAEAEALLPAAWALVKAVRERDADCVAGVLDVVPGDALAVVLAEVLSRERLELQAMRGLRSAFADAVDANRVMRERLARERASRLEAWEIIENKRKVA